jgi:transcriptional regulator with PAS, ATPase and Fis domain
VTAHHIHHEEVGDPVTSQITTLHAATAPATPEPDFVFCSEAMTEIRDLAYRVAEGDAKTLITGESGVGKDVIARLIHARSRRASHALVAVNCAAFNETLLESELFGHVRGSFTGAYRDKPGKLQMAHRGTIFLDEVGEMSLRMQALLLRFLETGELQAVGEDGPMRKVDVRLVSATNRNLPDMVAAGQFREDLLYRIRVVHIHVPPLRERPEDVRALVEYVVARTGRSLQFTESALQALERYRWPGNVRELQNVVEQLAWIGPRGRIDLGDLPPALRGGGDARAVPARERRRQMADDLFAALQARHYSFWEHIHPLFLEREITRHDLRELVKRGLRATQGNYRALLPLFGIEDRDYKKFLNFLTTHRCMVDFRDFRRTTAADSIEVPSPPEACAPGRR